MFNGALCAVSTAPRVKSRKPAERRGLRRGGGDHGVADPGQRHDVGRDGLARVDQGAELGADLAAAHPDRADLGDACAPPATSPSSPR